MTQQASRPQARVPTVKPTSKAGTAGRARRPLEVNAAEGDIKPWDLDSKLRVVKGSATRAWTAR